VEVRTGMHELGYTEITLPDTVDRATTNIVVRGAYSLLSKLKNTESETGD
jgi:cobalt-zinc-cadmium efflux system membrane fusion protein